MRADRTVGTGRNRTRTASTGFRRSCRADPKASLARVRSERADRSCRCQCAATAMAVHATHAPAAASPSACGAAALSPLQDSARHFSQRRQSLLPARIAPAFGTHIHQARSQSIWASPVDNGVSPPSAYACQRHGYQWHRLGSLSRLCGGSALGSERRDRCWERRRGQQTCAAVQQERLPPGESRRSGGGGGGLDRFFSNVTGFPFPIGPNFVRRTIRFEVRHPLLLCDRCLSLRSSQAQQIVVLQNSP